MGCEKRLDVVKCELSVKEASRKKGHLLTCSVGYFTGARDGEPKSMVCPSAWTTSHLPSREAFFSWAASLRLPPAQIALWGQIIAHPEMPSIEETRSAKLFRCVRLLAVYLRRLAVWS